MSVCRAVRVGLFAVFVGVAWLGGEAQEALAQKRPSLSPREPAKVSPLKEIAPKKETGISESRYTAGFLTGAPQAPNSP